MTVGQVLTHARIDQQAYGLVLTVDRPDSDQVPTPFGPMLLPLAAATAAMDAAAVHAWDMAAATGQNRPLEADLAEGIRPAADPHWRPTAS